MEARAAQTFVDPSAPSVQRWLAAVDVVEWEADGVGVKSTAYRVKPGLQDWSCCLRLRDLQRTASPSLDLKFRPGKRG